MPTKEALLSDQKPLEPETLHELWSQGKLSTEEALRHTTSGNNGPLTRSTSPHAIFEPTWTA
jgi:hypothetical protein